MKREIRFISVFLFIISMNVVHADDLSEKIREIKKSCKEITKNQEKYSKSEFVDEENMLDISIYKSEAKIKIITVFSNADKIDGYRIYFKNNLPIFIFFIYEGFSFDGKTISKDENRYYLSDRSLIKFLKGIEKKDIQRDSDVFKEAEDELEELLNSVKRFAD